MFRLDIKPSSGQCNGKLRNNSLMVLICIQTKIEISITVCLAEWLNDWMSNKLTPWLTNKLTPGSRVILYKLVFHQVFKIQPTVMCRTKTDISVAFRHNKFWRIKNQLDATYYFIVLLIGSTCFAHYYAHHQELTTIMLITTMVVSSLVCCRLEVRWG